MKIRIVESHKFLYVVKDENIRYGELIYINLTPLAYVGEIGSIPLESLKYNGKRLLGLAPSYKATLEVDDKIRKPNLQEYLLLSRILKQDGLRYNKKTDKAILTL